MTDITTGTSATSELFTPETIGAAELPLIPVFTGTIQGQSVQLCDARTLHTYMGVLRDFSNWIKGRINKFKFVEGVDFLSIARSPELASGNRGAAIDYHLTLDMGKELSMVENNEKGREARRYFLACEKQALAQASRPMLVSLPERSAYSVNPGDTLTAAQAEQLRLIFKEKCDTLPKDEQAGFMIKAWSKLKSHFGVTYRKIPQREFSEAVSLATRHAAQWDALPAPTQQQQITLTETPMTPTPAPALPFGMDTLSAFITSGLIDKAALLRIATDSSMALFQDVTNTKDAPWGEQVAAQINSSLPQADLRIIVNRSVMELFGRAASASKNRVVPQRNQGI